MAVCSIQEPAALGGQSPGANGSSVDRSGQPNNPFVHNLPSTWKSRQDFPAGFHLEEEMATKHLNFLSLMLVILIIKVKIIIRKR
jgi:hypothetical protein